MMKMPFEKVYLESYADEMPQSNSQIIPVELLVRVRSRARKESLTCVIPTKLASHLSMAESQQANSS